MGVVSTDKITIEKCKSCTIEFLLSFYTHKLSIGEDIDEVYMTIKNVIFFYDELQYFFLGKKTKSDYVFQTKFLFSLLHSIQPTPYLGIDGVFNTITCGVQIDDTMVGYLSQSK